MEGRKEEKEAGRKKLVVAGKREKRRQIKKNEWRKEKRKQRKIQWTIKRKGRKKNEGRKNKYLLKDKENKITFYLVWKTCVRSLTEITKIKIKRRFLNRKSLLHWILAIKQSVSIEDYIKVHLSCSLSCWQSKEEKVNVCVMLIF